MIDLIHLFQDPTIWAGLFTLVLLEVVLGIDNLIFIAILADKLPPSQRDRARQLGLVLALVMRLLLLASVSWLMGLTKPLFILFEHDFSIRDLILMLGGFFLIFKATREIHERLEGHTFGEKTVNYGDFWLVVAQIVVLDAVFSIDSVITAIGMSPHLPVMMIAVVLAVGIMLLASKPLTGFVNAHPTVVMLCLGFLLMVGFSLVADGVGFHIPKGYLYTAIAFSVLIELFNQITIYKIKKRYRGLTMRERTAEAVLRLLGGNRAQSTDEETQETSNEPVDPLMDVPGADMNVFSEIEREMMRGVLKLGERSVKSIMTPRHDLVWLDINESLSEIRKIIRDNGYSQYLVCDGDLNDPLGIIKTKDIAVHPQYTESQSLRAHIHPPLAMPDNVPVLNLLEKFRSAPVKCAIILDEYGSVEGIVTVTDILGAIAGEFGQDGDDVYEPVQNEDGSWIMEGEMDIHRVEDVLGIRGLVDENNEYVTLAGFILWQMKKIPHVGEYVDFEGWRFTVQRLEGRKIADIEIRKLV